MTQYIAVCWELLGAPGDRLDLFLAQLLMADLQVESIKPAEARYRITGDAETIERFKERIELNTHGWYEDWSLDVEMPPVDSVQYSARVAPESPFRRTVFLHGMQGAVQHMRMAIDARLQVVSVGTFRWAITGSTAALMSWMAEAQGKSVEEMMALWHLTPDDVAAEDATNKAPVPITVTVPVTVPLTVTLPETRTTTTAITRNDRGEIVKVDQQTVDVG